MRPPIAPRFVRFAPLLFAAGLVVSACTSTAGSGWTFQPPPTASPAGSGGASAAPSGSSAPASAAPSAPASAAPSVAPSAPASVTPSAPATASAPASAPASGVAGGTVLKIKAENISFDVSNLTAPAGQPFQIDFQNEDAGTQHDVAIKDAAGAMPFRGDLVTGVAEKTYNVPALPAGSYMFVCVVHPAMTGTLDVK